MTINLDGRRLKVASTDPNGVVSAETILTLSHIADVVTGHYEGGAIIAGVLVGRVDTTGGLRFCYAQTDRDGRIDGGISAAVLDRMPRRPNQVD
jgi:hypothetical protein